ncbi:hypothetical protein M427DRAFT_131301 [Gonapodya prolifera JEL478]|uniref:F-box domain-containing protein n=1 Tax=Gonapodya prolifera (strain JEL478) TaxID=1344416 RepID=A0A139AUX0_GONPJ|nr:hypothetical protein M427DRAFT_131301 [Gonapodya prolifera JEL478]|eukprot:KXS20507.1 hypothetical protein M427DRAFT_131301 [Gonapodya prolifera JEL478]
MLGPSTDASRSAALPSSSASSSSNRQTAVSLHEFPIEIWSNCFLFLESPAAFARACTLFNSITSDPANRARWLIRRHGTVKAFHHAIWDHSKIVDAVVVEKLVALRAVIARQDVQHVFKAIFRPRPGYGLPTFGASRTTPLIRFLTSYASQLYGDNALFEGDDYRIFRDIVGCITRSHTAISSDATPAQIATLRTLVQVYNFNPQHARPPLTVDKLAWLLLHSLVMAPDVLECLSSRGLVWTPALQDWVMGWCFLYYCLDAATLDPIVQILVSKYGMKVTSGVIHVFLEKLSKPEHGSFRATASFTKLLSLSPNPAVVRDCVIDFALEGFIKKGLIYPLPPSLPFALLDLPVTPDGRLTLILEHLSLGKPLPPSIPLDRDYYLPFPSVVKDLKERGSPVLKLALRSYLATNARGWPASDEDYTSALRVFSHAGASIEPSDLEVVRASFVSGKRGGRGSEVNDATFLKAFFGAVMDTLSSSKSKIFGGDQEERGSLELAWISALEGVVDTERQRFGNAKSENEVGGIKLRKRRRKEKPDEDAAEESSLGLEDSEFAKAALAVLVKLKSSCQRVLRGGRGFGVTMGPTLTVSPETCETHDVSTYITDAGLTSIDGKDAKDNTAGLCIGQLSDSEEENMTQNSGDTADGESSQDSDLNLVRKRRRRLRPISGALRETLSGT